jgi:hypothetical protein
MKIIKKELPRGGLPQDSTPYDGAPNNTRSNHKGKRLTALILLPLLFLVGCFGGFSPDFFISWSSDETLTYKLTVLSDAEYAVPFLGGVDYFVKPDVSKSGGTYTTNIKKTGETGNPLYTVTSTFSFTAAFKKEQIAGDIAADWMDDGMYVSIPNTITATTSFYGTLDKPVETVKTVNITNVTCMKNEGGIVYNTPEILNYKITAKYENSYYKYSILALDGQGEYTKRLFDFRESGEFKYGGIVYDNEILTYLVRATDLNESNYKSASLSVRSPDPYAGVLSTINCNIINPQQGAQKLSIDSQLTNARTGEPAIFDCYHLVLFVGGSQTGEAVHLYYASNDKKDFNAEKTEQKLIRMEQSYLRYDLIERTGNNSAL